MDELLITTYIHDSFCYFSRDYSVVTVVYRLARAPRLRLREAQATLTFDS